MTPPAMAPYNKPSGVTTPKGGVALALRYSPITAPKPAPKSVHQLLRCLFPFTMKEKWLGIVALILIDEQHG